MPTKKLTRPKKGRVVAGVCLGLSNYFKVDVVLVRIIFAVLLVPGGLPGFLPYLLLWLFTPEED